MKFKILVLFFAVSTFCYGQKRDSVVYLPKSDIVTLANKLQLLRDSLRYNGVIIFEQDTLIRYYKQKNVVSEEEICNRESVITTLQVENKQLQKTIELLEPKWYEDKWLWFGSGVIATMMLSSKK